MFDPAVVADLCDAEVEHHRPQCTLGITPQQNVGWLEIAMKYAVVVRVVNPPKDGQQDRDGFARRQRPTERLQVLAERWAFDVLLHEPCDARLGYDVRHADKVRMAKLREDTALGDESFAELSVLHEIGVEDLYCVTASEHDVPAEVNGRHAARAEFGLDLVPLDNRAGLQ